VVEFDREGNTLWQAPGPNTVGIGSAVRNGHVLVALYAQGSVVQLDRTGKVVWRYETAGYNPFLARQR
jgi:outer membrane protein assembly factor BamB